MKTDDQFLLRIVLRTRSGGFDEHYTNLTDWLDENCGIDRWSLAVDGAQGVDNDVIAVYVSNPTCALRFIARWCLPSDQGLYELAVPPPTSAGASRRGGSSGRGLTSAHARPISGPDI